MCHLVNVHIFFFPHSEKETHAKEHILQIGIWKCFVANMSPIKTLIVLIIKKGLETIF